MQIFYALKRVTGLFFRVNFRIMSLYNNGKKPQGWLAALIVFLSVATGGVIILLWFLYVLFMLTLLPISNFFLLAEPAGRRALTRRERGWAIFNGVVIFTVLLLLGLSQFQSLFFFGAGYIGMFALGVYVPQGIDWWRVRREEKMLTAETAP